MIRRWEGSVSASIGTDEYDVHVKADGELGHAEAKGQFRAGIIEKEDANGNKTTERGVGMEFGAEAYMNNLLILVIGCGLSVPFHLPDWKTLIVEASDMFDLTDTDI